MPRLRVLVACEFSGRVRDAFARLGHWADSCDLLPSEAIGGNIGGGYAQHYTGDVLQLIRSKPPSHYDLMVAHPPCTYLAVSGARWFKTRRPQQEEALDFFRALLAVDIPKIAVENPVSVVCTRIRKPDQWIQPWQFGHGVVKKTGLWLKNLPPLKPTNVVEGRKPEVHHESPGPERWKNRSRTYHGIAEAMAMQWGGYAFGEVNDLL